jgi:hypothetical protein
MQLDMTRVGGPAPRICLQRAAVTGAGVIGEPFGCMQGSARVHAGDPQGEALPRHPQLDVAVWT